MQIRNSLIGTRYLVLLVAAGMASAATLSNADKQFMIMAAKTDMTEAHAGEMAKDRAAGPDVKTLAQAVVQDHTASYTQLGQLAAKTGIAIPVGIDVSKDRAIERLIHLKGNRFDQQFTKDEIVIHRQIILSFKREAKQGRDADVKAYAAKMIPILEKHLHAAEECAKSAGRS